MSHFETSNNATPSDTSSSAEQNSAKQNNTAPNSTKRVRHANHVPTDTQGVPIPDATAAYLDTFFATLESCGVRDVVVSPGSRSTSLSMKAFERFGDVYVDVDERSAAFFVLGLAKAKNKPVCVICTSGTAVGNWMPAVLEAGSSRVPVIFLSSDRPSRLQHVGAPQTCDQIKMFGDHVKKFVQMPMPDTSPDIIAYARQMALELVVSAQGIAPGVRSSDAGPVHANFPFDNPLKPTMGTVSPASESASEPVCETSSANRANAHADAQPQSGLPLLSSARIGVSGTTLRQFVNEIANRNVLAVCGEGCAETPDQVKAMVDFAHAYQIPLIADPLSGIRCMDDPYVIDNYDNLFDGTHEDLLPQTIVRFGRWPVSKGCGIELGSKDIRQIVVDVRDTRDMTSHTSAFIQATPRDFVRALLADVAGAHGGSRTDERFGMDIDTDAGANANATGANTIGANAGLAHANEDFARLWISENDAQRATISAVTTAADKDRLEGAYVMKMLDLVPEGSLLFSASSMSIRAIDTFYEKSNKRFALLCNRGLNGIDGTVSSAIGAGQSFDQTTLLIGDLAMQHDASGLALQNEMRIRKARGHAMPSISIVVLDNDGGAIFDMLPQKSDDDYFKRLFLTPQNTDFVALAAGYHVDAVKVNTVDDFAHAYAKTLGNPGVHMVIVDLPLQGVKDRYAPYK